MMSKYKKYPLSLAARVLVVLSAVITAGILLSLIAYILIKGIPNLAPELFSPSYTAENVSMLPAIAGTLLITVLSLVCAVPVGVCAAIYLVEYAKPGNKIVPVIRITAETLSGIPSIVYGLFGFLMFVIACGWGYSMLAGVLTLAIMILPLIIRTTEEALLSVPDSWREGSFGLGASRLRTVVRVVLPAAMPGILSGIILAIGRVVGESAALIFTAGTAPYMPEGLFSSVRTLSVHMYALLSEGLFTNQAYATAVVLLALVIGINALSKLVAKKLQRK